jgi:DNA-binding CsgD family transcriptional regulator
MTGRATRASTADTRQLVDAIHDGSLETPPWSSFLVLLEHVLGCGYAVMIPRWPRMHDRGHMITAHPHPQAEGVFLDASLSAEDPMLGIPKGKAVVLSQLFPGRRMVENDYYRQMLEPYGMIDLMAMEIFDRDSGLTLRLRCAPVVGQSLFREDDRLLVESLEPRLRASLRAYVRLLFQDYQCNVFDEATKRLAIGSIVLNEKRKMLLCNTFAQDVLAAGRGLLIRGELLHCTDRRGDRLLQEAMNGLLACTPGCDPKLLQRSLIASVASEGNFWSILIRRVASPPTVEAEANAALVVLFKAGGPPRGVSVPFLIELFGLTSRESELAIKLTSGVSLGDSAHDLNISRGTARVHLRSIFHKTGTERQHQLVSLILNAGHAAWV